MQEDVHIRDLVLAMSASTDSRMNQLRFKGKDFAPTAAFSLLKEAYEEAIAQGIQPQVGNVITSDFFYHDEPDTWKEWAAYGVLAVEMETAALYTLAAKYKVEALTILTVSDSLITENKQCRRKTNFF